MLISIYRRNSDQAMLLSFDGHDEHIPADFHLSRSFDSACVNWEDDDELDNELQIAAGYTFIQAGRRL